MVFVHCGLVSVMQERMQFKEGDTVSVFEGTHEGVRADRSMQYIGRVVGFDTAKDMWKVRTQNQTLTRTQTLTLT